MPTAPDKAKSTKEMKLVSTLLPTDEMLGNAKVAGKWSTIRILISDVIAVISGIASTDKVLKGDNTGKAVEAASTDVVALFGGTGLDPTHYLAGDGTLQPISAGTGIAVTDKPLKGDNGGNAVAATAPDVIGLFSGGALDAVHCLAADGTIQPIGGGGGGIIASTRRLLKGDNAGSAIGLAFQIVGDADATILPDTDVVILGAQLTATRTLQLPLGTSVDVGKVIQFRDPMGYSGAGHNVNLLPVGGDIVNGGTGAAEIISLQHGFGEVNLATTTAWGTIDAVRTSFQSIQTYNVIGVTSGGSISPGYVGEFVEASIDQASAVPMTSGVPVGLVQLLLQPGEWEICGWTNFHPSAGAVAPFLVGWIGTVSGSFSGTVVTNTQDTRGLGNTTWDLNMPFTPGGFRCSVPTYLFLTGDAVITSGTVAGYGGIRARRVA